MTYLHGTVFTRQYLLSTSHITQYIHLLTLQSQQTKKNGSSSTLAHQVLLKQKHKSDSRLYSLYL